MEEPLESLLLVDGVADGGVARRVVEDEILLGATPSEEVADDGSRLLENDDECAKMPELEER
jgi:hypothetical protein